jgi:GT2 family glycosyltransferase
LRGGFDVVTLKRFIFYLDASSSQYVFDQGCKGLKRVEVETVLANALGGGSVAIAKDAYKSIGGFDEEFNGWGGEDNEFWDRCLTRKVYDYAYLPVVHLWHEAQPGKRTIDGNGLFTAELTKSRRSMPPANRIAELTAREWGQSTAPFDSSDVVVQ